MAHPVRPDSYIEINNFYTVTIYEKGAEVVRMMQTLVGRDGFARGITLYFERHDGQAVTCDDFAQAIADANPAPSWHAAAAVQALVRQAGTPRLAARGGYDAPRRTYTLTLRAELRADAGQPRRKDLRDSGGARPGRRRRPRLPLRLEGEAEGTAAHHARAGAHAAPASIHLRRRRRRAGALDPARLHARR